MAKTSRPVVGKVVAITGGARGIGRATAAALSHEGAVVAIGDLDQALAEQTATELGDNVRAYRVDVTDRESFERFLNGVRRNLGPIDVLINNAGIMQLGSFVEEDDATAARQVEINLHGTIYGMKLALPEMIDRRSGHIVNLASQAGKTGYPGGATYSATKFAVVGLSEAVELELEGSGVDISVVMPVVVNTELAAGVGGARFIKNVEPQDVATAIVAAIKRPRFDVHVPSLMGPLLAGLFVFPRKVKRLAIKLFGGDRVLVDLDGSRRAAYEDRATHSVG